MNKTKRIVITTTHNYAYIMTMMIMSEQILATNFIKYQSHHHARTVTTSPINIGTFSFYRHRISGRTLLDNFFGRFQRKLQIRMIYPIMEGGERWYQI